MKNQLYKWFEHERRVLPWRETQDPYAIWISEIILQQTRVEQGLPYYLQFIERFPDVRTLAAASEDEVLRYWQGLGYYSRARNLHRAAQEIMTKHNGCFPRTFDEIRSLPGIGDYTAGAIAAFAYNLPYPALDGNVYRVLARLSDCEIPFDTSAGKKHFRQLAESLLDPDNPRLFDSAVMEFGALYCVPQNPDCEHCPLALHCLAYAHNTVSLLPVRKAKPQIRDRWFEYAIYLAPAPEGGVQTLIHQRRADDIWKHLWEFPLTETTQDAFILNQCKSRQSSKSGKRNPASSNSRTKASAQKNNQENYSFELTHILSHQRIHARFTIYKVPALPKIADTRIVNLRDLDEFAFSRLTLKAALSIT